MNEPTASTVSYTATKINLTMMAMGLDPEDLARYCMKAVEVFAKERADKGAVDLEPISEPDITAILERTDDEPSPRKWWHKLLGLHPTHPVVSEMRWPGWQPSAKYHELRFSQRIMVCPPELHDRVRETWKSRGPGKSIDFPK